MLLALLQDAAEKSAEASKTPTTTAEPPPNAGIDVAQATSDLVSDPGKTVARWVDMGWTLFQQHAPGIIGALAILVIAYLISKWVRRVVLNALLRARIDMTLAKFFANLAKWAIIIFAFVSAAGTVGMSTAGFAAMIGAAGLAIGLALQGNLGNMAAGVLLLIFRPFKIGDAVIVAGQAGVIDGIDLFTTNVDTVDNRRVIIPNGAIFGGVIENQSHHPRRRIDYNVTVPPTTDIDRARGVFQGVIRSLTSAGIGVLEDGAHGVALTEIAPNQVWTLSIWVRTISVLVVRERMLIELRRTIDREGLGFPIPVQHVRQIT
ncbi:MAG: mechanosensitive ion channel [Phycisphaerales bacterium]|nr:mechanosensitive ion channel [Phycisphaerales bacterium]